MECNFSKVAFCWMGWVVVRIEYLGEDSGDLFGCIVYELGKVVFLGYGR